MKHTPEEVIGKLGQLQPDEIARLFRDEGVTGVLGQARRCPVASYVRRETGVRISIYDNWSQVSGDDFDLLGAATPPTVFEFIRRFDGLEYPDLRY